MAVFYIWLGSSKFRGNEKNMFDLNTILNFIGVKVHVVILFLRPWDYTNKLEHSPVWRQWWFTTSSQSSSPCSSPVVNCSDFTTVWPLDMKWLYIDLKFCASNESSPVVCSSRRRMDASTKRSVPISARFCFPLEMPLARSLPTMLLKILDRPSYQMMPFKHTSFFSRHMEEVSRRSLMKGRHEAILNWNDFCRFIAETSYNSLQFPMYGFEARFWRMALVYTICTNALLWFAGRKFWFCKF